MRSSGILRSVYWYFLTSFSEQLISLASKDQEIHEELGFLTLEYGTDRLSRNVGKKLPLYDE